MTLDVFYNRLQPSPQVNAAINDAQNAIPSIENTLIQMAWDVYSEDRAFDDIYIDDFTDATGIDGTVTNTKLTGNSTGIYDSANSLFKSGQSTGLTADYTSSQLDCSAWADINSATVTQTTPGSYVASTIYHAVSFDGGTTYKVFKTTWQTVAYNNGGTWQYNNAGLLTNASPNSLAGAMAQSTAQAAYQWTKANVDAVSDADWNATGGWSTSTTTINWTYRLVDGSSIGYAADATATSTADLSANGTWGNANTCAATSENTASYAAWHAFDQGAAGDGWSSTAAPSSGTPQSIGYDFGSGNAKIVNKYSFQSRSDTTYTVYPQAWKFQGSNDTNAVVGDAETANGWTTLAEVTGASTNSASQVQYYISSNTTAYRKYRFRITANNGGSSVQIFEIKLLQATTTIDTPTFTKVQFNCDEDFVDLNLRTLGWEASVNDPESAYCVLDIEPVDSITLGTDLKAYVSMNDGSNYEEITGLAIYREIGVHDFVRGDITGLTARNDKTMRLKITSLNSKQVKIHAIGMGVKY